MTYSTMIGPLRLSSPLILGSFDALVDSATMNRCFELCGDALGAVVTKSTTLDARAGFPEPKVARFGDGLLVASGNTNPGIHRMCAEVRQLKTLRPGAVILGSIVSDTDHPGRELEEEYVALALAYAQAGVAGIEMNLSCPHLDPREKEHTLVPAQNPDLVARLVAAVKSGLEGAGYPDCPVIPKLTGWNCDPAAVAVAAEQAGADAVTISNLFPGTGYYTGLGADKDTIQPATPGGSRVGQTLLGNGKGAYSGKAMHSAVLLMIENLVRHIRIPVLGSGGCASDLDALVQALMAGATAVETVTPFYFENREGMENLGRLPQLLQQLGEYLDGHGLRTPQELLRIRLGAARA